MTDRPIAPAMPTPAQLDEMPFDRKQDPLEKYRRVFVRAPDTSLVLTRDMLRAVMPSHDKIRNADLDVIFWAYVTAVDSLGNESAPSRRVFFRMPRQNDRSGRKIKNDP